MTRSGAPVNPPASLEGAPKCRLNAIHKSVSPGILPEQPALAMRSRQPTRKVAESQALRCDTDLCNQILLVPITEVLLTSKDSETDTLFTDLVSSEEFLGSHVLKIASQEEGAKENGSFRENRNKARQYTTLNGRTVVIKESFVYSNKGRAPGVVLKWRQYLTLIRVQKPDPGAAALRRALLQ